MLIATAGFSIPILSDFLQRYLNKALGPVLVLTGAVILDLLPFSLETWHPSEAWTSKLVRSGAWGSAGMGFLLALAFCPVSAALFFGALIPLTLKTGTWGFLPFVYGLATAVPVLLSATAIAGGTASLTERFERLQSFANHTRAATGVLLVLLGVYFTLRHIFLIL